MYPKKTQPNKQTNKQKQEAWLGSNHVADACHYTSSIIISATLFKVGWWAPPNSKFIKTILGLKS
jgi:hypothetical protein